MKKVKIQGKLKLNKESVTKLSSKEMSQIEGGWTGSIGVRCTQIAGGCFGDRQTKGWACNDDVIVINH